MYTMVEFMEIVQDTRLADRGVEDFKTKVEAALTSGFKIVGYTKAVGNMSFSAVALTRETSGGARRTRGRSGRRRKTQRKH
jgi:hypothetical protein